MAMTDVAEDTTEVVVTEDMEVNMVAMDMEGDIRLGLTCSGKMR